MLKIRWAQSFCRLKSNQKSIMVAITALLILVDSAGFGAESVGLIEIKETGTIDWARGVVQAKGISAPIKKESENTIPNSRKALSAATNIARHRLLETLKQIKIDSKMSVGSLAQRNKTIMAQIKSMAYDAREIENLRRYMSNGSVEVHLQMDLYGGFSQLVLPKEIRQIETITQIKTNADSSADRPEPSSERYNGLLVDARQVKFEPSLMIKILDENLEQVFGPAYVSREFVVQRGMAAYYIDLQSAQADPRIANYPLVVKALRTDWPNRSNIIISNADASKLESASDHLQFLKESRVVVLISPPSSGN